MKSFYLFFWTIVVFTGFTSCNSENDVMKSDSGRSYYPVKKGLFQIYDVERTQYSLGIPTTITYQLKTVVVDSFLNAENTYTYVMYRSIRSTESDEWQDIDTWAIRSGNQETVVQIENLPSVNLKYPVRQGLEWDGNKYNSLGENLYKIESVKTVQTLGANTFDDCLTVEQKNNEDYIVFLDQRKEIYARNIGLIYKDSTALHFCTQNECLGEQQIEQGVIYKQIIRSYGVE